MQNTNFLFLFVAAQLSWTNQEAMSFLGAMLEVATVGDSEKLESISGEMISAVQSHILKTSIDLNKKQIISHSTSKKMNKLLRKVVTDKKGTASLANIFGYEVGGKTGTAQNYQKKKENINTFISVFPSNAPKYVLLVLLDNPQPAPHIIYNYRGNKIKVNRNEAGWNSVYVSGKIIEKIGPILAINNNELYSDHVVKKIN